MGLQLRLTHSLGERIVDVEARPAENAIVVGRASNAQVQVPSASVAKAHCLLFVHEGHWVVQDAGSPSGTYLNGARVSEPAFVGSGDVITLGTGSNPPTITVDPHGMGVTEDVEAEPAVAAAGNRAAPPPPQPSFSRPLGMQQQAPAYAPPPPMPAAPPAPRGFMDAEENDNIFGSAAPAAAAAPSVPGVGYGAPGVPGRVPMPGYAQPAPVATDAWGQPATAATDRPRRAVKKKQQGVSGGTIAVVAVIAVVLVSVTAYFGVDAYRRHQAEMNRPPIVIHEGGGVAPAAKPKNMFDFGNGAPMPGGKAGAKTDAMPKVEAVKPPKETTIIRPAPESMAPKPTKVEEMSAAEPEMTGPQDQAVADAVTDQIHDPGSVIAKLINLRENNPPEPQKKEIDKYLDQTLDILWCLRLKELIDDSGAASAQLAEKKLELAQAQDPEFKKTVEKEIAKVQDRRDRAEKAITEEMKFTGKTAPNPHDPHEVALMRKNRDPEAFKAWRAQVENSLRKTRGREMPWRPLR